MLIEENVDWFNCSTFTKDMVELVYNGPGGEIPRENDSQRTDSANLN